jgi:hypothetical protein
MSEANGTNELAMASATRELFLLGQKTVEARAVLAALNQELHDANTQLADNQQLEQLIEANQQLVLGILLAQADAEKNSVPLRNSSITWRCAKPTSNWSWPPSVRSTYKPRLSLAWNSNETP